MTDRTPNRKIMRSSSVVVAALALAAGFALRGTSTQPAIGTQASSRVEAPHTSQGRDVRPDPATDSVGTIARERGGAASTSGDAKHDRKPPKLRRIASDDDIVEVSVSFRVRNTNNSLVPCDADGGEYTMTGVLVAPQDALAAANPAVTVYVPGATGGRWHWSFKALPGFDHPVEMARLGHISIVIDRLGHGESERPNGHQICVGSEADVLHQIVLELQAGAYRAGAAPTGPVFDKVALAGISLGSAIAQVEAYSFGDIDALVLTGYADPPVPHTNGVTELAGNIFPKMLTRCPADEDGWFRHGWDTGEEFAKAIFHDPDPSVAAIVEPLIEDESCGSVYSVGAAQTVDQAAVARIDVPVLIVNGEHDFLFRPEATMQQAHRYPQSPDADAVVMPDGGHGFFLESPGEARAFRAVLSAWLDRRGF